MRGVKLKRGPLFSAHARAVRWCPHAQVPPTSADAHARRASTRILSTAVASNPASLHITLATRCAILDPFSICSVLALHSEAPAIRSLGPRVIIAARGQLYNKRDRLRSACSPLATGRD